MCSEFVRMELKSWTEKATNSTEIVNGAPVERRNALGDHLKRPQQHAMVEVHHGQPKTLLLAESSGCTVSQRGAPGPGSAASGGLTALWPRGAATSDNLSDSPTVLPDFWTWQTWQTKSEDSLRTCSWCFLVGEYVESHQQVRVLVKVIRQEDGSCREAGGSTEIFESRIPFQRVLVVDGSEQQKHRDKIWASFESFVPPTVDAAYAWATRTTLQHQNPRVVYFEKGICKL